MLHCSDFEPILNLARRNDFVFVDPPYTVVHNLNGFVKYNDRLFSWPDQIRLHAAVRRACDRGAKVLVLNANHESLRSLYRAFPQQTIPRQSILAANPRSRKAVEELAITCWER
jgi:DNA adenine methylase